jgi:hypothetical protein
LNANPSTLQAINGANPLQVVTSILGNFMYPVHSPPSASKRSGRDVGEEDEPKSAQSWRRMTAIPSWQKRKKRGTCREQMVRKGERRGRKRRTNLDSVENPLRGEEGG